MNNIVNEVNEVNMIIVIIDDEYGNRLFVGNEYDLEKDFDINVKNKDEIINEYEKVICEFVRNEESKLIDMIVDYNLLMLKSFSDKMSELIIEWIIGYDEECGCVFGFRVKNVKILNR